MRGRSLRRPLLVMPLAACLDGGGTDAPPLREIALYAGQVTVSGPPGYCIDRQSLRRRREAAFVLIAGCAGLTGQPDAAVAPAVLTVSVLPEDGRRAPPDAQALAALVAGADILQSGVEDGLSYVQLSSGGAALMPLGDPRHWRGGMAVAGHPVGLAVYGPEGSAVAGDGGLALMRALAAAIRAPGDAPQ